MVQAREPNFDRLRKALLRQGELDRVPMLELKADNEIVAAIMEIDPAAYNSMNALQETELLVKFWTHLGFDAVRLRGGLQLQKVYPCQPAPASRE